MCSKESRICIPETRSCFSPGCIEVDSLEAIDGTPIVDIKPLLDADIALR